MSDTRITFQIGTCDNEPIYSDFDFAWQEYEKQKEEFAKSNPNASNESIKKIADNIVRNKEVQKLGQLEDIEEELGIDLITLFKAFENGIYYTNYGHGTINYCDKPKLIPCYLYDLFDGKVIREVYNYDFIVSHKGLTISTKTYKKFWALTKEELE